MDLDLRPGIRTATDGQGAVEVATSPSNSRILFLDALRALAALLILWHHFALYPPLSEQAAPLLGPVVDWFRDYARATQVFFVIGGYVMARSLSQRPWTLGGVGRFVVRRYLRLGLPYLGAIALAIFASAMGRGWLPLGVVGSPPDGPQLIAHLLFLQDILGYEALSAGLWFVCINFQLGLIYVATLYLRDTLADRLGLSNRNPWVDVPITLGWLLSLLSLFWFNLHPDWDSWGLYFFPYFFMGIIVHRALRAPSAQWLFWLYLVLILVAMGYDWRWRLASALVVGSLLFAAETSGLSLRWPRSRAIAGLGRASYSLFLIHFPVLVLVASLWARLGWGSPAAGVAGLLVAFAASLVAALVFYRFVELPAARLSGGSSAGRRHSASKAPAMISRICGSFDSMSAKRSSWVSAFSRFWPRWLTRK